MKKSENDLKTFPYLGSLSSFYWFVQTYQSMELFWSVLSLEIITSNISVPLRYDYKDTGSEELEALEGEHLEYKT